MTRLDLEPIAMTRLDSEPIPMTRLDSEPIPGRPLCTAAEHQLSPLAAMVQDYGERGHSWPETVGSRGEVR